MLHASSWAGNPARERCTREEWQGGCTGGPREALVCARGRRFCVLERGSLQYRDKRRGKVLGSSTCGAHQTELEETKRGLLARRLLAAGGASHASRRPYASARCPNEPGGSRSRQCRTSAPSARARLPLRRARRRSKTGSFTTDMEPLQTSGLSPGSRDRDIGAHGRNFFSRELNVIVHVVVASRSTRCAELGTGSYHATG